MKPRVSVIMGIYNCASTLPEALDSLYNQTYKEFKIIMCDDASTDDTFEVANNYASKHENTILIRNKKNLKLAATLNHCLEYVDTEYVARMDGDDISLPERFKKEINFLDSHPDYALVSCPMVHFDESGEWGQTNPPEKPTKNDFKIGTPFCHAPCMIRSSVFKEVGGYTVNEKLVRGQDYYLWYKIYREGYQGYNINEPLYKMRDGRAALRRRTISSRINAAKIRVEVLKGLKVSFPYMYALLLLMKAFIPPRLMTFLRKSKMRI